MERLQKSRLRRMGFNWQIRTLYFEGRVSGKFIPHWNGKIQFSLSKLMDFTIRLVY